MFTRYLILLQVLRVADIWSLNSWKVLAEFWLPACKEASLLRFSHLLSTAGRWLLAILRTLTTCCAFIPAVLDNLYSFTKEPISPLISSWIWLRPWSWFKFQYSLLYCATSVSLKFNSIVTCIGDLSLENSLYACVDWNTLSACSLLVSFSSLAFFKITPISLKWNFNLSYFTCDFTLIEKI